MPKKLILDVDTGTDDAVALMLAVVKRIRAGHDLVDDHRVQRFDLHSRPTCGPDQGVVRCRRAPG